MTLLWVKWEILVWLVSVCAHMERQWELTAGEADEGQHGARVTVFTIAAVWRAHLGKLVQEVLRGQLRFYHRRRWWWWRWGGLCSAAFLSITVWKMKVDKRLFYFLFSPAAVVYSSFIWLPLHDQIWESAKPGTAVLLLVRYFAN